MDEFNGQMLTLYLFFSRLLASSLPFVSIRCVFIVLLGIVLFLCVRHFSPCLCPYVQSSFSPICLSCFSQFVSHYFFFLRFFDTCFTIFLPLLLPILFLYFLLYSSLYCCLYVYFVPFLFSVFFLISLFVLLFIIIINSLYFRCSHY